MSIQKKIIFAFAMAGAFVISGNAMAAETFGESANTTIVGPTGSTTADTECALLSENVTLGVSANVMGGYACDEGNNLIQVAACHEGGSRDEVSCASWTDDDPATTGIDETNHPAGCSDNTGVGDPDFKAFFASSNGGVMQEKGLGTRCTEASLGGLGDWAN